MQRLNDIVPLLPTPTHPPPAPRSLDHGQAEVSLFFVSVALLQTTQRGGGPRFNPVSPLHRMAYRILGVAKPPPRPQQQQQQRAPVPVVPPPTAPPPETGARGEGRRVERISGEVGRRSSLLQDRAGESAAAAAAVAVVRATAGVGPGAARWGAASRRDHRRVSSGNSNGSSSSSSYSGSRHDRSGSRSSNGSNCSSGRRSGNVQRGSSSRRGRGRGSRGSLSRGPGYGGRSRSRLGKGGAARRLFVRGAAGVWGPGRISERGVGRAFIWTVAAITVIVISRCVFCCGWWNPGTFGR